ncbi:hypothetical protein MRB53_039887 [Persea americana]|nr:hypothetical protein MRB53_039887 [Persea americana]
MCCTAPLRDSTDRIRWLNHHLSEQHNQVALESQILSSIETSGCNADTYIIVSQPGVEAADFKGRHAAPHLRRRLNDEDDRIMSSVIVPEVVGEVDVQRMASYFERTCGAILTNVEAASGIIPTADAKHPQILSVEFDSLPANRDERALKLLQHDSFLNALIDDLESTSFTVLYTSTYASPSSDNAPHHDHLFDYEAEESFPSALHTDLKRDLDSHSKRQSSNSSFNSKAPLFEKYSFLSPVFINLCYRDPDVLMSLTFRSNAESCIDLC